MSELNPFDTTYPFCDMLRGYIKENNTFVCLECEFSSDDEKQMKSHWHYYHQKNQSRFIQLLNADASLDFTYIEKMVYYRFFIGMKNKEIAKELNIKISTVNSMRLRLKLLYNKSKIIVLMGDMFPSTSFKENKKSTTEELIPGLDGDTDKIIGFYNKHELHHAENPIPHATILIIVAQKNRENNWTFLVTDKANKMSTLSNDYSKPRFEKFDFIGGHIEQIDFEKDVSDGYEKFIGKPVSTEVFTNAAKREFFEELTVRGTVLNPDLIEFCEMPFNGPTYPTGWNVEKSMVYVYVLPDHISQSKIRVKDSWTDSCKKRVFREYTSNFRTWDELEAIYDANNDAFMDGAKRVIETLNKNTDLKHQLFEILNTEK